MRPSLFAVALAVLQPARRRRRGRAAARAGRGRPLARPVLARRCSPSSRAGPSSEPIVVLIAAPRRRRAALRRRPARADAGAAGPDDAAALLDAHPPAPARRAPAGSSGRPPGTRWRSSSCRSPGSGLQDGADPITACRSPPASSRRSRAGRRRCRPRRDAPCSWPRSTTPGGGDRGPRCGGSSSRAHQRTPSSWRPPKRRGCCAQDGAIRFRHPLIPLARSVGPGGGVRDRRAAHAALARVLVGPARRRQVWHRAPPAGRRRADGRRAGGRGRSPRAARGALAVAVDALQRAARLTPTARGQAPAGCSTRRSSAHDLGPPRAAGAPPRRGGRARARQRGARAPDVAARGARRGQLVRLGRASARSTSTPARSTAAGDPELAVRSMLPIALRLWWSNPDEG